MTQIAWARFTESVGTAFHQLASDLRAGEAANALTVHRMEPVPAPGKRQQQVLAQLQKASRHGMTTREIAETIDLDHANAWNTLHRLEAIGHVELIPGLHPQRWRLADTSSSSQT